MPNWTDELRLPESESRELVAIGERSLDIAERMGAMVISSEEDVARAYDLLLEARHNIAAQEAVLNPYIANLHERHQRATSLKRERIGPIQERKDELNDKVGAYLTTALKEDGEIVPLPKGMSAVQNYTVDIFDSYALHRAIGAGKVPGDVCKGFNESKIKAYAKQGMDIPGCFVDMEINVRVKDKQEGA